MSGSGSSSLRFPPRMNRRRGESARWPLARLIVALLAALAFSAYALCPANYAACTVVLTVLIALLVEFSGGSPVGELIDRIIDTALGTAIALGACILWPTREAPQTRELQDGVKPAPALASPDLLDGDWPDPPDPQLTSIATETATIRAALDRLEHTRFSRRAEG